MTFAARKFGISFEGQPGIHNAITDVSGVEVGYCTLQKPIEGKTANTGVTIIMPNGKNCFPVFGASYALNGNGEMTGTTWLEESGFIENPIGITNTHSVGIVRDSIIEWVIHSKKYTVTRNGAYWAMPIVAETYDGKLNDINAFHIKKEHVMQAIQQSQSGDILEGNVGGGTGMILHEFKGGSCTASRVVSIDGKKYTLGVFAQANHGERRTLQIKGIPIGQMLSDKMPLIKNNPPSMDSGSIIVVIATDAPLLPHQLKRLCRRVPMGISKLGAYGANSSGDIFLSFSTANKHAFTRKGTQQIEFISNDEMDILFEATIQATEESLVNCLLSAEDCSGYQENKVYALPKEQLKNILTEKKLIR